MKEEDPRRMNPRLSGQCGTTSSVPQEIRSGRYPK